MKNFEYWIDVVTEAVSVYGEYPYSESPLVVIAGGVVGEHIGRQWNIPEGTGALAGIWITDELTEDKSELTNPTEDKPELPKSNWS